MSNYAPGINHIKTQIFHYQRYSWRSYDKYNISSIGLFIFVFIIIMNILLLLLLLLLIIVIIFYTNKYINNI